MALTLVPVPIGHPDDITLRAIESLKQSDLVIGEDRKPLVRLLSRLGLREKPYELLNEHSNAEDIERLKDVCLQKRVALVSDAGSPGFCDPGAKLIASLIRGRKNTAPPQITALPGPSALTTLLSLASFPVNTFFFLGFPPVESHKRAAFFKTIPHRKEALVLMDTPYRLKKTVSELASLIPQRSCVLGCDLSKKEELIHWGKVQELPTLPLGKAEFMILLAPL